MTSTIDAHVLLDTHPTHPSAVIATLTGAQAHVAHLGLEAADWTVVADNVLVLVRIDHEEPYWAQDAGKHLSAGGITVEITPRLQKAMDEEWTWASYPMPWCTRSEVREVSNQAQKIHDDIRHGQLLIHAHAHDGQTTVAVGTYLGRNGKSVYLHGEDHLRQVADTFDSPAGALVAFEKLHAANLRPGPAPLTDTERAAAEARTPLTLTAAKPEPALPEPKTVPAYLADASDHDVLLDTFLDAHGAWEKRRTWSDDTTQAIHESQTLRVERVHEADPRETAWTIDAYESPVGDRVWHATATSTTPIDIVRTLLDSLAYSTTESMQSGISVTEKTVAEVERPLTDANWACSADQRHVEYSTPDDGTRVQLDVFAAQSPSSNSTRTWTIWGDNDADRPTWAVHLSEHTPTALLQDLTFELAHRQAARRTPRSPLIEPPHLAVDPKAAQILPSTASQPSGRVHRR